MESINDKDVVKKKKRRKRKKSTAVKTTVQNVETRDKAYDTAKLEKLKEDLDEKLDSTRQVPIHMFSIKNLFVTVLATCLVVLVIVAGYLVGLFDSLRSEPIPDVEFGTVNSIETEKKYVDVENYKFLVPSGYQLADSDAKLKVNNLDSGFNLELIDVLKQKDLFDEDVVEEYKEELTDKGYVIYGTYFTNEYEDNFLVYSGVDSLGDELRMIYAPLNKKKIAKIMVTSEYEAITNDILDTVYEMLNK